MENKMLFGDLLSELLALRGWTASKLAREINVDGSYVRKWIRGERIPALKSNHVEKISACLSKGINKEVYEDYIETLGYKIETSILDILREAQINSLTVDKNYKVTLKKDNMLSKLPSFVKGKEEVFKYVSMILDTAYKSNCRNKEILMTFQGDKDILDGYEKMHDYFIKMISKLVSSGWTVRHLWRLKSNDTRTVTLVRNITELLKLKKAYEPRYFIKYGTITPPFEFIIIDDLAAVLFISDETNEYISSAFFHTNKDEIETLRKHVLLMSLQTRPILNYDYGKNLDDIMNRNGDIFSFDMEKRFILHQINNEEILKNFHIKEIIVIQDVDDESTLNCFKNMLYLLENCPNYKLAILDKIPLINNIPKFMFLKENAKLLIKVGEEEGSIEEPITISGFKDFFMSIWDEISPINKDREYSIKWIKDKLG
ncbi:helix-turn-helix domain-containing protein [Clostridium hydrogenum]|uniref:helix-turn-helix domain-containing protein n=1 Tax=Clostridium hydrogenum TaxID=2855764 RepID=UPI001F322498|nr:helix-turn-helix transcriptional regulator [Clostridium hydrogenum]